MNNYILEIYLIEIPHLFQAFKNYSFCQKFPFMYTNKNARSFSKRFLTNTFYIPIQINTFQELLPKSKEEKYII